MSLRLALDTNNLVVAFPGQNALTATPTQRQFDGNFASPARFLRGKVSATRSQSAGSTTTHIDFGKSIPPQPFVMINVTATNQWTPGDENNGGSFAGEAHALKGFGGGQTVWSNFVFNWTKINVVVTDSYMEITLTCYPSGVNYDIDYIVFDFPVN